MSKELVALKYFKSAYNSFLKTTNDMFCQITISRERANEFVEEVEAVEEALLKAEKDEKIILGIEDYLNLRIKVEPLGDVRKAFIEIRNQLQVIKEVLEWFLKCDHW